MPSNILFSSDLVSLGRGDYFYLSNLTLANLTGCAMILEFFINLQFNPIIFGYT